jgi:hypothetical protein
MILLLLCALVTAGSVSAAQLNPDNIPKMMTWTAYDVGSVGYFQVGHISTTLFEKFGTKIRVIPAGTDIPRVYPIRLKDADVAFHGLGSYFMQEGLEDYASMAWGPQPVRALYFAQHPGLCLATRGDSDVKKVEDLKGERVAHFPSGALTLIVEQHLVYADLTWDQVQKVDCPGYTAAIRMLMEGKLQATHVNPTASLAYEMEAMPYGLRWIELPHSNEAGWKRIKKNNPAYGKFLANIGAGLSEENPIETTSYAYPIALAYDFLSADRAYIITKLLFETYPDYAKKDKSLKAYWHPKRCLALLDDYPVPIHRGAIRYLKEIGEWTQEREARNQQLLEHQAKLKKVWDEAVEDALERKIKSKEFPAFWLKKREQAGF